MMATTPYIRTDDASLGAARAAAATATKGAGEVGTTAGDTGHRMSTTAGTTEGRPTERSLPVRRPVGRKMRPKRRECV